MFDDLELDMFDDCGSWAARRGGGTECAGQRLRSGAFAPDCPCVILVVAYGNCLRIPLGLSTPRAPPAPATPGSVRCNLTSVREDRVLRVLAPDGDGEEYLAGPAPGRPRGRPLGAYVVSCVEGMERWVARVLVQLCKRRSAARHPSLPLTSPVTYPQKTTRHPRAAATVTKPEDAYADYGRPRGRNRRAP